MENGQWRMENVECFCLRNVTKISIVHDSAGDQMIAPTVGFVPVSRGVH
jgi:hypothetical protein